MLEQTQKLLLDPKLISEMDGPNGLHCALQRAIELEHATLPTYLYSYYSLGTSNPAIQRLMLSIILEEMLHFALACNILNAIGGSPAIDKPDFIPRFPGKLPGGVESGLTVHLKRFSLDHVFDTFMVIEAPDEPLSFPLLAVADRPVTIADFYTKIAKEIEAAGPSIFTGSPTRQVTGGFPALEIFPVTGVESALRAITLIKEQGEGTTTSPLDEQGQFAHYYRFAEIWHGYRLRPVLDPPPGTPDDQKYRYDGAPIPFDAAGVSPAVSNPNSKLYCATSQARYLNNSFNYTYTSLLKALHLTFNGQPSRLNSAIAVMHSLRELALEMMRIPVDAHHTAGPSFEYQPVNP
ncbi:MAG: hypothetical protein JWN34_4006 [Bryobacterales bacterium]|nr:hypothetical protein [Bryobacterales bacterium]